MKKWHLLSFFILVLITIPIHADTIHIPGDYPTFSEAIDNSQSGDTILVAPGTYHEHFIAEPRIFLSEEGPEQTTIVGTIKADYGLYYIHPLTISGFTITGYHEERDGILTMTNCTGLIENCHFIIEPDQIPDDEPWTCISLIDYSYEEVLEISYCVFNNKHYARAGGAISSLLHKIDVHHTLFINNTASSGGGALYLYGNCSNQIWNNVFINNSATIGGAILYEKTGEIYSGCIYNNIFINNTTSTQSSGAVHAEFMGDAVLAYNCFWNNTGGDFNENVINEGGNIFVDPMFVDPDNMDFHLDECSYCIDTGHPDSDYANEPEPNGGRINMGMYGNTSDATSWGADCPTRIPTATPTPTPIHTSTPYVCDTTGVTIDIPKSFYHAGDIFYCTAHVCNQTGIPLYGYPLFMLLDVHGEYFFAPSFSTELDSYLDQYPYPIGDTEVIVLQPFEWPENAGSMEGVSFIGALTDPGITQIIGQWDQKTFGWE